MPEPASRQRRALAWGAVGVVACVLSIAGVASWAARDSVQPASTPSGAVPSALASSSAASDPRNDQPTPAKEALERRNPGAALQKPVQSAAAPASSVLSSEERAALRVDALVKTGQIGAARSAAEKYFREHPNGPQTGRLSRLTGAHPVPSGPR